MLTIWDALVRSRRFWVSHLSAGVDYADCPSLRQDNPGCPADEHRLEFVQRVSLRFMVLRYDPPDYWEVEVETGFGEHFLRLRGKGRPKVEWGRLDCHCFPDALRPEECELMARAVARRHGPLWAARLLLIQYVALTPENADGVLAVLRADLAESGHFSPAEIDHVAAYTRSSVRADFRWEPDPELGWVAEGKSGMSFREAGVSEFVAVKEFLAHLEACERHAEPGAAPDAGRDNGYAGSNSLSGPRR